MEIYTNTQADKVLSMAKEYKGRHKPAFGTKTFDRMYKTMDGLLAERHVPDSASQVVYLMTPREYMDLMCEAK